MSTHSKNEILWTKEDLIRASKGKDLTTEFLNDKKVTGISIDSRSIKQNDLLAILDKKCPNSDPPNLFPPFLYLVPLTKS